VLGLRVHLAERIHIAHVAEELVEPGPLLGQESRILLVGAPVLEIDFLVGDVPIATQNVVASPALQPAKVRHELGEEAEFRLLPHLARGSGREIDRHHAQALESRLEVASLRVELPRAEAGDDLLRLHPRVDRDAAVAFALGVEVIAVVAGRMEDRVGELVPLRPGLLDAHHVGLPARQPVEEPLARRGANAVGVERDDAHERAV
jgi:hypothetical protein